MRHDTLKIFTRVTTVPCCDACIRRDSDRRALFEEWCSFYNMTRQMSSVKHCVCPKRLLLSHSNLEIVIVGRNTRANVCSCQQRDIVAFTDNITVSHEANHSVYQTFCSLRRSSLVNAHHANATKAMLCFSLLSTPVPLNSTTFCLSSSVCTNYYRK